MAEELRPCPLCGSTDVACFAEECGDSYDNVPTFRAVIGCLGCHEEGCDSTYDDEPCFGIEAYYRADHPLIKDCEDPEECERVLEWHMAKKWNRRAGDEKKCILCAYCDIDEGMCYRDPNHTGRGMYTLLDASCSWWEERR